MQVKMLKGKRYMEHNHLDGKPLDFVVKNHGGAIVESIGPKNDFIFYFYFFMRKMLRMIL